MKALIRTLDRFLTPVLILGYVGLCIVLLAVVPGGKVGLLLAILWAIVTMVALRWSIWGILNLAKKKASAGELKILTRTVEGLFLLITVAALIVAVGLWDVPSVWLFLPTPLFGFRGAVRFDAERL